MKLPILKTLIFLVINACCSFAVSFQDGENEDSFHNYDLFKLVEQSAEHLDQSKSLKLLSEEDKKSLHELEKYFPIPFPLIPRSLLDFMTKNTSNKCIEDLKYVFQSFQAPGGWAMKMLDSYGKPESGILLGNMKWLGRYEECLGIYAPPSNDTSVGDFHGKYCTFRFPVKLGNASLPISTAVCLPESCNPSGTMLSMLKNNNLTGLFSFLGKSLESSINNGTVTCKATSRKLTSGAIGVIFLLSIFALLAVIGSSITAYEYFLKALLLKNIDLGSADVELVSQEQTNRATSQSGKETLLPAYIEKCKPFFNCFCLFTNGEKIINMDGAEGQLPCLHGIRFLSMTWVILAHTYGSMGFIDNGAEAIVYIDHWTFQIILNGFFSVDSFFVLSGFLVGYLFFQQAKKTDGKIPWLYFYIHRYVRLTPVYMLVIAFYTTIIPFLGSGPLWPDAVVNKACSENWWWNALYINNFQAVHEKQCLAWSWYLANDMQFYIISPLFLVTLWRWPKIGYSLIGLFFGMTFVTNFVLTYVYDLIAGVSTIFGNATDLQNLPGLNDFFMIIYYKPYARIGSYLVGLVMAYYVCLRKWSNAKSLSWATLTVGWIVASAVTLTCQFGLYHQNLSTVAASFYNAFSRVGFSMGLGWVIFVCVIGQGGVVNSILSWKVLIPLSRLTYCAYLLHPIVMSTYTTSMRTLINFNHTNVIMLYFGFLAITYAVALLTSLLFESPIIRLERLIKNKFAS